jgi:hypothetical protein
VAEVKPRVEVVTEERLPLDKLGTPPPSDDLGQGIPVFEIEDDGLSPTERSALRNAAKTAEVDAKPNEDTLSTVSESAEKNDRRSRLFRAAQRTAFEARGRTQTSTDKDAKIQDLETKLDRLQIQMDELLRRLSQDDDSNHSSGAA